MPVATTMLRSLPEQKSLVYFASGLRLNGADNQAQLRATTNAAIRANVTRKSGWDPTSWTSVVAQRTIEYRASSGSQFGSSG